MFRDLMRKKKEDIFNRLKNIVRNGDKSYYVEMEALISLGEYINERSFQILSEAVEKPNTFNDIVPTSAIAGLSKYSNALEKIKSSEVNEDEKLHLKLLFKKAIEILIKKTQKWNSNNIRTSAVDGLKAIFVG